MDQYVSSAQLFSVTFSPSFCHCCLIPPFLPPSPSFPLCIPLLLLPHLNPLFLITRSLSLHSFSLLSFFKSRSLSVNHSPPSCPFFSPGLIFLRCQLPSPHSSLMATCHSVNLFFLTLNHCLHHLSPSSISLSLSTELSSLPLPPSLPLSLSKAGVYFCALLICHCCSPTKRHILLSLSLFHPLSLVL